MCWPVFTPPLRSPLSQTSPLSPLQTITHNPITHPTHSPNLHYSPKFPYKLSIPYSLHSKYTPSLTFVPFHRRKYWPLQKKRHMTYFKAYTPLFYYFRLNTLTPYKTTPYGLKMAPGGTLRYNPRKGRGFSIRTHSSLVSPTSKARLSDL